MKTTLLACWLLATQAHALTIIGQFIGGEPPTNIVGAGNLTDCFNAAAADWKTRIADEHTVVLRYKYGPLEPAGRLGTHIGLEWDSNGRETLGEITIDNDGLNFMLTFFLDPTPYEDEEFADLQREWEDYGGGLVLKSNAYGQGPGLPLSGYDMRSLIEHEIGHGLGLASGMPNWPEESADGSIHVRAPLPYAGTVIPLARNCCVIQPHIAPIGGPLMEGLNGRERRRPCYLDLLAICQMSHFHDPQLEPRPRLQIQRGRVSWSRVFSDYKLNVCEGIGGAWREWDGSPSVTGNQISAPVEFTVGTQLFRLERATP